MPINKERVRLLVAALRSGEFPQTRSGLRNPGGYCCLAVADEVFHMHTGRGEWVPMCQGSNDMAFCVDRLIEGSILHSSVAAWFGLDGMNPSLRIHGTTATATGHNDGVAVSDDPQLVGISQKSFYEIADAFEALLNE